MYQINESNSKKLKYTTGACEYKEANFIKRQGPISLVTGKTGWWHWLRGISQYRSLKTGLKQVLFFLEFSWCSKMSLNLVPAIKGERFLQTSQISSGCLWNPSNFLLHFWSLHWRTHWTRGLTLTSGNKLFTIVLKILFPV